jgi:hypothetical protein
MQKQGHARDMRYFDSLEVLMRYGFMLIASVAVMGCSHHAAQVTGRVTCEEKPVVGSILFSPAGEGDDNTGPAVSAPLDKDGVFKLQLKTTGKHTVLITPRDVKFPVPAGQFDYPCDRLPIEKEVQPGDNAFTIEMSTRK